MKENENALIVPAPMFGARDLARSLQLKAESEGSHA
jgi:hypothetical protein